MRHDTSPRPRFSLRLLAALTALLLGAGTLTGCGSSGADSPTADSGEVIIGLTDARGDFLRYEVDVLSIRLTKANGAMVEALPVQSRIDFAELTELTEFVTAQSIPTGKYTAATLTLDYGAADVVVEDAGGEGVTPTLLDEAGAPVGVLEMEVRLDIGRPLVVAPGIPAHLTLDFDLAATHTVTWDGADATVTVVPVLVADVELEDPKPHRLRGPLVSVNEAEESFVLGILPLRARRHLGERHLGRVQVLTGERTTYEVDGVPGTGSEGFALLAAKEPRTAVLVIGELVRGTRRQFRAREVYAGSSVPGGNLDGVTGTILARSGDVLTVRGAVLDRDGGAARGRLLTVTLTDATTFSKQGDPDALLDSTSASVGQRVAVVGNFDIERDPLEGEARHLRLLTTHLCGSVVEIRPGDPTDGELDVDLQSIDGRPVRLAGFDFTGTGASTEGDADPEAYTLATSTLSLADLAVGEPVRAFGFVTPFGAAPPDFEAVSVVALAEVSALLQVHWPEASPTGVSVAEDDSALILDLSHAGRPHHLLRAGVATELSETPAPQIVPESDRGLYVLRYRRCDVYLSFAGFAAALKDALTRGAAVIHVGVEGWFDEATQTMSARGVRVSLR